MNERIQELADRLWRVSPQDLDAMGLKYRKEFYEQELKKFAELIVQECAEVLDTWNKENGVEEGHDKQGLISLWSSHFGVEE